MSGKQLIIAILSIFISACSSIAVAPVDSRNSGELYRPAPVNTYDPEPVTRGFHEVVQGDTLYSISFRYGLDYREVSRWNNISEGYVIYPGQRLRLIPSSADKLVPPSSSIAKPGPGSSIAEPLPPPRPITGQKIVKWGWPTNGNIIASNSPIAQKGVDITGTEGQDIEAAAEGIVVYSGSGLLGYGKLIIIKHNETFLSAYAHNQVMQVKEGDTVNAEQIIGKMGKGSKGTPLLHFEIRREGKPVDPLQYLPTRS